MLNHIESKKVFVEVNGAVVEMTKEEAIEYSRTRRTKAATKVDIGKDTEDSKTTTLVDTENSEDSKIATKVDTQEESQDFRTESPINEIFSYNKTELELSRPEVTTPIGEKTFVSVKTDARTFNISSTSSEVVEASKSRGSKIAIIGRSKGSETITITAKAEGKEEVSKDLVVNVVTEE